MSYEIAAVGPDDWAQLRELRLAAPADPVAEVAFGEPYARAAAQDEAFWRGRAAQGRTGVGAETFIGRDLSAGGRWAGMLTVLLEDGRAWVVGVCVRPEHRGAGLARQLMAAAQSWAGNARGGTVRRMVLHVNERNPRAERFYRRLGFAPTGEGEPDKREWELRIGAG